MAMRDSIRLAVGTLTVLPVGPVSRLDRRVAGTAMLLSPLAVLPLGLAAAGLARAAQLLGSPALVCGLLAVAVLAVGTRALHLDGLADTVDGLGSGWDRNKALAVMRRGDVGPMGVTALILVLGLQAVAMGQLTASWSGAVQLAVLICCSRAALTLVCRRGVPAARADGLGVGVAGSVPPAAAVVSGAVVAMLLVAISVWRDHSWWSAIVTALVAAAAVALLVHRCVRRLGGVTGDVMGAAVEVALTVLVLGAAR